MDSVAGNPHNYSTLSHALHPQIPSPSRSPYTTYSTADPQHQPQQPQHHQPQPQQQQQQQQPHHPHHHQQPADTHAAPSNPRREEEEEEEEEEDEEEVEGEVDRRLSVSDHLQSASSQVAGATTAANNTSISAVAGVARRRPGRPKGSKNKRPRFDAPTSTPAPAPAPAPPPKPAYQPPPFYYPSVPLPMQPHPPPHPSVAPTPPVAPDPSNQQFYDFQWRVLTLCTEFYNAADELIRSAAPQVISQCYNVAGNSIDPISILHEARRACDQLLANPVQQVLKQPTTAPVPMYATTAALTKPAATSSPSVISNPGSFVMPLGSTAPGTYPYTPGRYPTTPYYAYTTQSSSTVPYVSQQQMMKPVNLSTPAAAGNQGAWSDDETERLKKLAADSKGQGEAAGEIDWDWVCNHWGSGRTRHQILIKATTLGLKESSTRIPKKRRETDAAPNEGDKSNGGGTSSASPDRPTSTQPTQVAAPPPPVTTTPVAPPQQPPQPPVAATNSAAATATSTTTNSAATGPTMTWAMPPPAAPSPILASPSLGQQPPVNRSYYRERTTQQTHILGSKPVAGPTGPGHSYYQQQPNGNTARGTEQ